MTLTFIGIATESHAQQAEASVNIPLYYYYDPSNSLLADEAKLAAEPRAKISKKVLTLYDRIVQRRNTPFIIAAVNHSHKFCDVCSRSQTPQRIIEVGKKNSLLTCESCGSLLVWRDD